ncbi:MAG: type II secretion system protein [Armatimonadota bacterium]
MSYQRQLHSNGFTLIELLVVIGIIAILAAISSAVYMHAKEKGRQTQCLSNIRQLAQATIMYASENEGLLPPFVNNKPPQSDIPDMNPGTGIQNNKALYNALNSYINNKSIWFCQTDQYAGKDIDKYMINHKYSSYFFNFSKSWTLTDNGWMSPYKDSFGRYTSPSKYRLIMDPNFSYYHAKGRPTSHPGYNPGGCEHFDGGVNCAYLDGHAIFLTTPTSPDK